jgi:hypothetical protein
LGLRNDYRGGREPHLVRVRAGMPVCQLEEEHGDPQDARGGVPAGVGGVVHVPWGGGKGQEGLERGGRGVRW